MTLESAQTILVTGATGQLGANVCQLGIEHGYRVRALVRSSSDAAALAALGPEPVLADLMDPEALDAAVDGVDGILHTAAATVGYGESPSEETILNSNQWGAINLLAAAERAGGVRTVMVSTGAILQRDETVNENSRIRPIVPADPPYVRSKRAAFYESMSRAARGQDVSVVFAGGIFGPSPLVPRATAQQTFNNVLLMALRGQVEKFLPNPVSWAFAPDAARTCLAALEHGRIGARYMAYGRVEDVCTTADFCNEALRLAGLEHRVESVDPSADSTELGVMAYSLRQTYPEPALDGSSTANELDLAPLTLEDGLSSTLAWFRSIGAWS